jgi:hypothetical protein
MRNQAAGTRTEAFSKAMFLKLQYAMAPGRTADALSFFEEQVTGLAETKPEQLRVLFDTIRQRLEFMCATLETENAYNIFKSLNSTGVPLGPSDLIRNFIFMHVPPNEQDEFDREIWGPLDTPWWRFGEPKRERRCWRRIAAAVLQMV